MKSQELDVQKSERVAQSDKLKVFRIQRTCVHDGPGIRSTIFFQGCGLRCVWCQNPEGLSFKCNESCMHSIEDILNVIRRDKKYYFSTQGGVTLSGGEPLLQESDNLIALLKEIKKEGIKIACETTLHAPWENIEAAVPYIDLFYVDFKVVGNDDLHLRLTKNDSKLIQDNLKKLLELKANISFRMVIVPGLNDSYEIIKATSDLLKSSGYNKIELLKYHNMYESKAKRLGIEQESLNITAEQSLQAIKKALTEFKENGIEAFNVDVADAEYKTNFSKRVLAVQQAQRDSGRAVCFEVSKLKTKFYKKNGFDKPTHIHRAERLAYVLKNKTIKAFPDELLVGNFTAKRVAGQVWEEHFGALGVTFLHKISRQKPVAFKCDPKDRLYYYFKIFPFWVKHGLVRKVNPTLKEFKMLLARSSEMIAGFNNNMAAIAHFIVNCERLLKLGTSGIKKEIRQAKEDNPEKNQAFYEGAIIALEGLEAFAERYADMLLELSREENDESRRKELYKMSEVCRYVPKNPASSYHEALQSITFMQIALCIESFENAVSFGRLDQILYPYYKKDLEEGKITYEEAKELLCLFVLKMDEAILVNDGNSYLNISKLFETLSTDQTITFGGVDKEGNDATNDITYMFIDACELQPLAINMTARINKNSPDKYLKRLAEIYINGCPMPEMFSDDIYIESILRHYPTTLEHARNYAIVGCVEPNASDDHFGNTDCANVNLALPFLQALKGQDYELWNFSPREQTEKIFDKFIDFAFSGKNFIAKAIKARHNKKIEKRKQERGHYIYNPPSNMEELIERFQEKLNKVTKEILADHAKIEEEICKNFTTPLASSLFEGCVRSGLDVNEGGATFNSAGIQAIGVTDVADSLYALNEVVFKKKIYSLEQIIKAIDANFEGEENQKIRKDLQAVQKYGDDSSREAADWVSKVMHIYNNALDSAPCPRNGRYSAGYYALNVSDIYGKKTPALPSGRLKGVPLANSVIPHYEMEQNDLLSALNSISDVNFTDHADNGTTVTFTIDSALFPGEEGVNNLAGIFKTFLTSGGMQLQPNIIDRKILIEAYNNPEKHKYLMVRVAGYCAYFNELSDDLKKIIINRTCYS